MINNQHKRKGEQWGDKAKGYEDWGTCGGCDHIENEKSRLKNEISDFGIVTESTTRGL